MLIIAAIAFAGSWVLTFFTRLTGMPWICCYFIGVAVALLGAGLIFYAKLPLYRERRFFTFGPRALPEQRRPPYRWGYVLVSAGVMLLICLLLSKH